MVSRLPSDNIDSSGTRVFLAQLHLSILVQSIIHICALLKAFCIVKKPGVFRKKKSSQQIEAEQWQNLWNQSANVFYQDSTAGVKWMRHLLGPLTLQSDKPAISQNETATKKFQWPSNKRCSVMWNKGRLHGSTTEWCASHQSRLKESRDSHVSVSKTES